MSTLPAFYSCQDGPAWSADSPPCGTCDFCRSAERDPHLAAIFEAAKTGENVIPEASTRIDAENHPTKLALDEVSEATGASLEDLATAFLALRSELETDEQAVAMLRKLAPQAADAGIDVGEYATRFVTAAVSAATSNAVAVLRSRRRPTASARGNRIVVEGGAPSPRFGPDIDFSGKPTPEAEAVAARGAKQYHLETLAELEAESRLERRVSRGVPASTVLTIASALIASGLVEAPEEERPAGRPPTYRNAPKVEREKVGTTTGCGSAGCRTLADCLCTCRRCRAACAPCRVGE